MDFRVTIEPVEDKASKPGENITEAKAFPPGVDQITFGRERTNDLVFPPEARIVSRNHGRLYRQRSGDYAIEAFGDHYIEIDGYPAERGQHVKDGATIRLGGKNGPVIRARIEAVTADAICRRRQDADPEGGGAGRAESWPASAAIRSPDWRRSLVVAAAVAFLYARLPSLEKEMAALRETMSARAAADFTETSALRAAAYAVILRDRDGKETLQGTAWPYQPGILVTNAHVAVLFDRLRRGETLIVRAPGGGEDHTVTGGRLHPGYLEFKAFLDEAKEKSTGFRAMTKGLAMPSAYDVAVLEVDGGDSLGPGLEIAPGPADAVVPGASLAFAGYPLEGVAGQRLAQISPTPQLQFGAVTSTTDFFLFGDDEANAFLVQNSLPAAGGASGSAVVNKDGLVVAVLSGGTVVSTGAGRTPSAVLLNYAQRADLVAAALDPSLFDAAAARARWEEMLARFDTHETATVAAARRELEDDDRARPSPSRSSRRRRSPPAAPSRPARRNTASTTSRSKPGARTPSSSTAISTAASAWRSSATARASTAPAAGAGSPTSPSSPTPTRRCSFASSAKPPTRSATSSTSSPRSLRRAPRRSARTDRAFRLRRGFVEGGGDLVEVDAPLGRVLRRHRARRAARAAPAGRSSTAAAGGAPRTPPPASALRPHRRRRGPR